MLSKWCVILFSLTFNAVSFAQNTAIDSLWQVWEDETQADTIRLNAIKQISWDGYLYSQPDSAFYYAQLQYELAKEKGLKKQMAVALNTQGVSFYYRGNYSDAIDYHTKSLNIRKEIGDKRGIAAPLNNIGNIYMEMGDYNKAIDRYTRSLKIMEEIGNKGGMAGSLNNIGIIYFDQKDYSKAIDYYTRSLKIMEEIGNKGGIAINLNNIGEIYRIQGDYSKAKNHYTRSLKIMKEIGNKRGIAVNLNNIGEIYRIQGDYSKAIVYHTRSLRIKEKIGDKQGIASSLNYIGTIYKDKGDSAYTAGNTALSADRYAKAINYSIRALTMAKEAGSVPGIKDASNNLYMAYKHIGNPTASLKMHELYITMRDSIENIETQKEVIRQEYKYNYEKQALADSIAFVKQRELDTLTHQAELDKEANQRYAIYAGLGFLLVLLVVYLRIRFIKKQAEKEALLQEIKLLKTETIVKMASSTNLNEPLQLNKEKIETAINASLNQSDWNILNALYKNPAISNRELAEKVSLSIGGTRSSLSKMYQLFGVKTARNQRLALVIEAAKLSNML